MADPLTALSTAASVVSLADVTIRACEGIYGLVASWRNAPRAVKDVRQTIEGIESTLRNRKIFLEERKSSVAFQEHHQTLPDSVNVHVIRIREDVTLLGEYLASNDQAQNFRKRANWAFYEKRIMKIVERLGKHQVDLILSLQVVAQ